jgi:hypothetical protein
VLQSSLPESAIQKNRSNYKYFKRRIHLTEYYGIHSSFVMGKISQFIGQVGQSSFGSKRAGPESESLGQIRIRTLASGPYLGILLMTDGVKTRLPFSSRCSFVLGYEN